MTSSIPFDTLMVVERLQRAGVPANQAKAQASVLATVMVEEAARVANGFAIQADAAQALAGLRADVNALRLESQAMNSDTKAELIRWISGVGVLQIALIAGLVLKLVH